MAWTFALAILLAGPAPADGPGRSAAAFESVRERLRVQVRGLEDPVAPGAVWRQDFFETRTVLVRLVDGAPVDVTVGEAQAWGRSPEELFALGLANLEHAQPPLLRQTPKLVGGVQVTLLYGDHPFGAAYVFAAARHPTCAGSQGTMLAIPNRNATLCYPVESSRAIPGFHALVTLSVQILLDGGDPIVPHVYWVREGTREAQLVRIDEKGRIDVERTAAFREMQKALPDDLRDVTRRRRKP